VSSIVDPYLRIQRALNADTVTGIQRDARIIALEAAKIGPSGSAMQAAAAEMQEAADLKAARTAFAKLGDAIIAHAKSAGASLDDVRVAYCPMAQKYWLQKGETIQNPYYGRQMSECGRIESSAPSAAK